MFLHTARCYANMRAAHCMQKQEMCIVQSHLFVDVRADKQSIHFRLSLMGRKFLWGGFQLSISDLKQSAEQM